MISRARREQLDDRILAEETARKLAKTREAHWDEFCKHNPSSWECKVYDN